MEDLTLTEQRLVAFMDHVWLGVGADFKMTLDPCGDTAIIEKKAVNNCAVTYLGSSHSFGGISERVYNHLYNYYFVIDRDNELNDSYLIDNL